MSIKARVCRSICVSCPSVVPRIQGPVRHRTVEINGKKGFKTLLGGTGQGRNHWQGKGPTAAVMTCVGMGSAAAVCSQDEGEAAGGSAEVEWVTEDSLSANNEPAKQPPAEPPQNPQVPPNVVPVTPQNPPQIEDDRPKRDPSKVVNIEQEMLRKRQIFLHGSIDDKLARAVCMQLMYLESEEPGVSIKMFINSPGGKVTSGLAIYDTMAAISSPVHTICCGRAFSMAAVLLAAGEPGHRICTPNSKVMVHQPSVEYGKMVATDVMIRAHETQRTKQHMNQILAVHTKQSEKRVLAVCERDYYMTPEEAKGFGIIDEVTNKWGDTAQTAKL
mmetsp:Transcript_11389/g.17931  ORF Transcript_11389/g.17931 Transcript_11389/m.17931 type:complete len:331 (-) Transcript_11389:2959-3951(-)